MGSFEIILKLASLSSLLFALAIMIRRVYLKYQAERKVELYLHKNERQAVQYLEDALHGNKEFTDKKTIMLRFMLQSLNYEERDAILKFYSKKTDEDQKRYVDKLIEDSGSANALEPLFSLQHHN